MTIVVFVCLMGFRKCLEAVEKRAIHITHNLTRGMPFSPMLLHVNLDSLATSREDLSRRFFRVFVFYWCTQLYEFYNK